MGRHPLGGRRDHVMQPLHVFGQRAAIEAGFYVTVI
jgi:hypothetical protein